jgi:acylphosphatase
MMKTVRIVAIGRVQGVGFRFFVSDAARRLGITGYARNMESRQHIEVVVSGGEDQLAQLLDLVRVGPPGARVDSVQVTELSDAPLAHGFSIDF